MAILDIVKYPDPRLREPTFAVTEITDDVRELVRDLKDTMVAADGAGIAAIQVGRLERIFLIDGRVATGDEEAEPVVFINPKVVDTSPATIRSEEGCLSFPGVFVEIGRPRRAKLQAMDLDGNTFEAEGEGLLEQLRVGAIAAPDLAHLGRQALTHHRVRAMPARRARRMKPEKLIRDGPALRVRGIRRDRHLHHTGHLRR